MWGLKFNHLVFKFNYLGVEFPFGEFTIQLFGEFTIQDLKLFEAFTIKDLKLCCRALVYVHAELEQPLESCFLGGFARAAL